MEQVGLRLHPDKTKIVYCQDGKRRGSFEHTSFTFLGFTFRRRGARDRHGRMFNNFLPAISKAAPSKISAEVRSWRLHTRTGHAFRDLARRINPIVRGWMQYYGAFYRSALYPLLSRINAYLGALDSQEISAATGPAEIPRVLERDHHTVSPHVRALEMGFHGPSRLVIRMTRAR